MEDIAAVNSTSLPYEDTYKEKEALVNSLQSEGAPQTESADTKMTRSRDDGIPTSISADSSEHGFTKSSQGRQSKGMSSDNLDNSTIGSATSEPTTDTARKSSNGHTNRATGGRPVSRASSRGSVNGTAKNSSGGRSSYRNNYTGNNVMQMQPSAPRPFARAGPLSYSKTVRLSGNGSPFSAREVDDKTRAVISDINEFESAQMMTE